MILSDIGTAPVIDSTILLIMAVFALVLMIFGFKSNKRIFNLIAVAPLVYLGLHFIDNIALVIMFFALILYNLYYTFFQEYESWLYYGYIF